VVVQHLTIDRNWSSRRGIIGNKNVVVTALQTLYSHASPHGQHQARRAGADGEDVSLFSVTTFLTQYGTQERTYEAQE
jgi:hypothetical protein